MLLVHATERIGKKNGLLIDDGDRTLSQTMDNTGQPDRGERHSRATPAFWISVPVAVSQSPASVPRIKLPSISTHRDSAEKDSRANYYVQRQALNWRLFSIEISIDRIERRPSPQRRLRQRLCLFSSEIASHDTHTKRSRWPSYDQHFPQNDKRASRRVFILK